MVEPPQGLRKVGFGWIYRGRCLLWPEIRPLPFLLALDRDTPGRQRPAQPETMKHLTTYILLGHALLQGTLASPWFGTEYVAMVESTIVDGYTSVYITNDPIVRTYTEVIINNTNREQPSHSQHNNLNGNILRRRHCHPTCRGTDSRRPEHRLQLRQPLCDSHIHSALILLLHYKSDPHNRHPHQCSARRGGSCSSKHVYQYYHLRVQHLPLHAEHGFAGYR